MNLMLVEHADPGLTLPAKDPRATHIRDILRMRTGDSFDIGAINGPHGKATITADDASGMTLSMVWGRQPAPSLPVELVIGLSRPQTMRKILREAPALGIAAMHVARCARSESGYAESSLWTGGEWRELLLLGTEQAFTTRVPAVSHHESLAAALRDLPDGADCIALDNYEATMPLVRWKPAAQGVKIILCIGPERGWDASERDALRAHGSTLAHLGPLVLRTETATIAGVALVAAAIGGWEAMTEPSGVRV